MVFGWGKKSDTTKADRIAETPDSRSGDPYDNTNHQFIDETAHGADLTPGENQNAAPSPGTPETKAPSKATSKPDGADRTLSFSERMRAAQDDLYTNAGPGNLPHYQPSPQPSSDGHSPRTSAPGDAANDRTDFAQGHLHAAHSNANFSHHHGALPNGAYGYDRPLRSMTGDVTRLGAALFTAMLFGLMIANPGDSSSVVKRIAGANPLTSAALSDRACRTGQAMLTSDFTSFDNVLSISPLGTVTAPGEILPVPYIRINTKNDGTPFNRRVTAALAPATVDVTAIERRWVAGEDGAARQTAWTVHMKPCAGVEIIYDRLDALAPMLIEKAGGLATFTEIGGPDHLAKQTAIRLSAGMSLGTADGFDVAVHDASVEDRTLARPERYRHDHYARATLFNISPELLDAITPDDTKAQCALDYLRTEDRAVWSRKLGDAWGIRRAKGENACRTALIDLPGTAQGAWYTDAAHNGATTKVSAVALAPDTINPDRLVFALHGRLPSLTAGMVGHAAHKAFGETTAKTTPASSSAAPADVRFVTFQKGNGLINRPFDEIRDEQIYCYEKMRVNFIGERINGVLLLQKSVSDQGGAGNTQNDVLAIEARSDFASCIDVPLGTKLSAKATGFFR
ncbi:MAG: hypothetical protein AAFO78_04590 [Pseudomonadota bacterium]